MRPPQVSNDPAEYIRKKIGKLDLNDITQLARLIDGHDALGDDKHTEKQIDLQEQILALLDPEESPDPKVLRQSLAQLLQGSSKSKMKEPQKLDHFFEQDNQKPVKPPRRLKGLELSTVKVPDFSDIFDESADTDATLVGKQDSKTYSRSPSIEVKKIYPRSSSIDSTKKFTRSSESPLPQKGRRLSEVNHLLRHSPSPDIKVPYKRSNSIGSAEIANTKRIAQLFEGQKRRHTPSPESRSVRSGSATNTEMALRMQRMAEIIEGKKRDTPSPDRSKQRESIGNPEMALRRQRVVDLIKQGQGLGQEQRLPQPGIPQRRNSEEMSFRMQRMSDLVQRKATESKRPKGGRRKAAREIMKQRFEKSLQMLAAEPRLDFQPSADLENDYGLQQYRASAPAFDDRVKKLEKKLQHYVRLAVCGME